MDGNVHRLLFDKNFQKSVKKRSGVHVLVHLTIDFYRKALTERLNYLKAEIEKAKTQYDNINRFMAIVKRYSDFDEITPEILRAFVDKIIIHEKVKVDGHYVHTIEIIYNFVEDIDLPDFDAHLREEN